MRPEHASIFNALNDSEAAILTIYGEARGELFIGKQAVAQVIANRADRWHKTVKAVCFDKNQFSCLISSDPNYGKLFTIARDFKTALAQNRLLRECAAAWEGDRSEAARKMDGATFYRVPGTVNAWFDGQVEKGKLVRTCQLGNHEFFREV